MQSTDEWVKTGDSSGLWVGSGNFHQSVVLVVVMQVTKLFTASLPIPMNSSDYMCVCGAAVPVCAICCYLMCCTWFGRDMNAAGQYCVVALSVQLMVDEPCFFFFQCPSDGY